MKSWGCVNNHKMVDIISWAFDSTKVRAILIRDKQMYHYLVKLKRQSTSIVQGTGVTGNFIIQYSNHLRRVFRRIKVKNEIVFCLVQMVKPFGQVLLLTHQPFCIIKWKTNSLMITLVYCRVRNISPQKILFTETFDTYQYWPFVFC